MDNRIEFISNKIADTLSKFGVTRAALFGSSARNEATDKSDIDILVEFDSKKSLLDLSELKFALENLLGKKVDVVTYNSINPKLKSRILSEQIILK
jgi:uncharacterized protein